MNLVEQHARKYFLLILLCVTPFGTPGRAAEDGNALYEAGKFGEAAETFRSQIEKNGPNAALLYNLGNAYFRTDDFGRAIHAYEQALALDPRSTDIRTNLRLAQEKAATFDSDEDSPLRDWSKILTLNQWGRISLSALGIVTILFLTATFVARLRRASWLRFCTIAALFSLCLSVGAALLQSRDTSRGIVLEKDTPVLLSPFPTAEKVATLPAGRSVELGKTHSDYYHVGQGWVSKNSVSPIYSDD